MAEHEKDYNGEPYNRSRHVEQFLTLLESKGMRFGVLEDKGILTDAVTVEGSTKAFDFAATTPTPTLRPVTVGRLFEYYGEGLSRSRAIAMAQYGTIRLEGNSALAGNLGIGIAYDSVLKLTHCAYKVKGKAARAFSFSDNDNEDMYVGSVLLGAEAYIKDEIFKRPSYIFPNCHREKEKGTQDLVQQVVDYASSQNWLITTSESCTGGFLAKQFAKTKNDVFVGGVTLYNEQQKIKEGVLLEQLAFGNVYSQEVALAMARATRKNCKADIAIATTGVMENPDTRPFHQHINLGTIFYAFIVAGKPFSGLIPIPPFDINGSLKTRKDLKTEVSNLILQQLLLNMSETISLFSRYLSRE